jgi:hypothetical protein
MSATIIPFADHSHDLEGSDGGPLPTLQSRPERKALIAVLNDNYYGGDNIASASVTADTILTDLWMRGFKLVRYDD